MDKYICVIKLFVTVDELAAGGGLSGAAELGGERMSAEFLVVLG